MPAATLQVVCLLLAQAGSDFELPQKPPVLRSSKAEKDGESKAPALRLGEPALRLGEPALGRAKPTEPKGHEPKTLIQPSSRQPASLERDEPEEESGDLEPATGPGFKARGRAAPAARLEASDDEDAVAPRAIGRIARAEPTSSKVQGTALTPAGALLRRALYDAHDKPIPGEPISLLTAFERVPDRTQQLRVVKAYWLLSMGVAEHHFAVVEAEFLAGIPAGRTAHDQAALAAARAVAATHVRQTELAATAAQFDLAELAQVPGNAATPLPGDVPYIGNYRTNFKELFVNRTAPSGLRRIDRTLPQLRDLIESQAHSVAACEKSVHALAQAHEAGEFGVAPVLDAFDKLRRQRREFLVVVRDYNFSIADYALAVVNSSASRNTVVATLIETVPQTKSVLVSPRRDVLPVSAEEPIPESGLSGQPTTADHAPTFRAPLGRGLSPAEVPALNSDEFEPGK